MNLKNNLKSQFSSRESSKAAAFNAVSKKTQQLIEKAQITLGHLGGRSQESVAKAWLRHAADKNLTKFDFLKQTGRNQIKAD